MDASTHTAYVLERQRRTTLENELRLRAAHRERADHLGTVQPRAGRGIRSLFHRRPQPACDPAALALAGPAA